MSTRRLLIISLCLLFIACDGWAQNLIQNPDFEGTNQVWKLTGGNGGIAVHPAVHGGKKCARIGSDPNNLLGAIEQSTGILQPGLYELTAWVSGKGSLSLTARKQFARGFIIAEDGWHQYSLIFELTEAAACDLAIEVTTGQACQAYDLVDDVAFVPADDERKAAWKKQQDTQLQLGYIPSGYSAQRPAPLAKGVTASPVDAHKVVPITRKVIFYDAKYDSGWVTDPELVAQWYNERGFEIKTALALAEWMKARIDQKDAYGSVAVIGMGIVPFSIIEGEQESCLLRRYMENGGRVVWMADTTLYVAHGEKVEDSPFCEGNTRLEKILNMTSDASKWSGATATITTAGKAWGLTAAGSCLRGVRKEETTISFSENAGQGNSAIWLKTINPAYPLSGFINSSLWVYGKIESSFSFLYPLALYTGTPVAIPKVERKVNVAPLRCALILRSGAVDRRAYVRGETVSIQPVITANTVSGPIEVQIRIVPGAPSMRAYDLGAERFQLEQYRRELDAFHAKSDRREPVLTKTLSLTVTAGKAIESEPIILSTGDLAVGNYEVYAQVKSIALPAPIEVYEPLAICAKPQFDRVLRYVRGGNQQNVYRLYGYIDDIIQSGLDTGPAESQVTQPLPDILLMEGRTFMTALETCHCLVENRMTADGKDYPNPWGGGTLGMQALAGAKARSNVYDYAFTSAKRLGAYPAFARVFECNDDWSARGGWDYNTNNLAEFKAKTGLDAPVPNEFKKAKLPTEVDMIARPSGVIDDNDPWLLWNTFLCRDIFGGLNDAERRGVTEGCPGSLVWMVPGGAQWPLFSVKSGLYPPYNFGSKYGLNAIGYYAYYDYWAPTLIYLYQSEMGRMANRDLHSWVMPDAGGDARHYIRNMTHLLLAAGVHGINYFVYDWLGKEGRIEHAELGRMLQAHGALLYRLKPAPKRVGLLVPFSEAIFETYHGLNMWGIFGALTMAHVDVEPVAEEELDACNHKAIALWNVKHLKASSVKALERYIQRGGIVLLDKDCAVPIAGARWLKVSFGEPNIDTYGKTEGINMLKETFSFLGAPEFDSPEPTTIFRPFVTSDGIKYVYVVQVDNYDEYQFWGKNIYRSPQPPKLSKEEKDAFQREHGMGKYVKDTMMNVQLDQRLLPAGGQVVDVYRGEALPVTADKDGRMSVTVTTRKFGGTLLAVLPSAIDRVAVKGNVERKEDASKKPWWRLGKTALTVKRGETIEFAVEICGKDGKPLPGVQSLALTLTKPDGGVEREVNQHQVAEKGICKLIFTPARNHPTGKWILAARELFTGKQSRFKFIVE